LISERRPCLSLQFFDVVRSHVQVCDGAWLQAQPDCNGAMQASQTLPDQSFGFTGVVAAYGEEVAAPDKCRSHGRNNSLNDPSADVCHGAPQFSSRVYQRPMMLKILCGPIVHVRTIEDDPLSA
jgi:hypothetical protein